MAWCGFLGAWLLVAGPVYQASIELREQDAARESIEAATAGVPRPQPISFLWWLLPPVAYLLQRRRSRQYRRASMDVLTVEQLDGLLTYIHKATGWLLVGGGGLLLAVKETWELCEEHDWPIWVWLVLNIVAAGAGVINTAARTRRADQMLAERTANAQAPTAAG